MIVRHGEDLVERLENTLAMLKFDEPDEKGMLRIVRGRLGSLIGGEWGFLRTEVVWKIIGALTAVLAAEHGSSQEATDSHRQEATKMVEEAVELVKREQEA